MGSSCLLDQMPISLKKKDVETDLCSPAAMAIFMEDDVETDLCWEYMLVRAESKYETDPRDADNLANWASALMVLSFDHKRYEETLHMWEDAVFKLKEAVEVDPKNHYTIWLLGQAFDGLAMFAYEVDKNAMAYFDMATQCFRKALDEDPSNKLFAVSLYLSYKAPEEHLMYRKDLIVRLLTGRESSSSSMKKNKFTDDLEARWGYEYALKLDEINYKNNPDNVDNLQRLASSLFKLSQYESRSGSMEMLKVAIIKLEHARRLDPSDPYTHRCLGKMHTARALLTPEPSMAMQNFEMATQCFREAVDVDPNTELFAYSLEQSLKAPEKYLLRCKNELLSQLIGHGSSAFSNAMGSKKVNFLSQTRKKVKFGATWEMAGLMLLSVCIVAWFRR